MFPFSGRDADGFCALRAMPAHERSGTSDEFRTDGSPQNVQGMPPARLEGSDQVLDLRHMAWGAPRLRANLFLVPPLHKDAEQRPSSAEPLPRAQLLHALKWNDWSARPSYKRTSTKAPA